MEILKHKLWILLTLIPIFYCIYAQETDSLPPLKFECPNASYIEPCTCFMSPFLQLATVNCSGPNITQENINTVISELRQVYEEEKNPILSLYLFNMTHTNMTSLDLTPFLNTQLDSIVVNRNARLMSISGPVNSASEGTISLRRFHVYKSPLFNDSGLGETLKLFKDTKVLDISQTGIEGPGAPGEFFPGISNPNLETVEIIQLQRNMIKRIQAGNFGGKGKIRSLNLVGNPLEEIGEDSLVFSSDDSDQININETIYLQFSNTSLTSGAISDNCGLERMMRPVFLYLWQTKINKLPEGKFKGFFERNAESVLFTEMLECDGELKWLKNLKEQEDKMILKEEAEAEEQGQRLGFKPRISDRMRETNCANDQFSNIFNSTKI